VTDRELPPDPEEIRKLARNLGISEASARALLGAVLAEQNPPPGKIVNGLNDESARDRPRPVRALRDRVRRIGFGPRSTRASIPNWPTRNTSMKRPP
jgi:hypothetical protein